MTNEKYINNLDDFELLYNIVNNKTKTRKILNYGGYRGLINIVNFSINEIEELFEIEHKKAVEIKQIIELSKRLMKTTFSDERAELNTSEKVARYYMQELRLKEREQVNIAILDTKNRLIRDEVISIGTFNCSLATNREIIKATLKHNGKAIIVVHNHPSGDPTPSTNDLEVTNNIKKACDIVGIDFIDHIIIGDNNYYSFGENGFFK